MKIASSEIVRASGHSYLRKYEKSERLRTWVDNPDGTVLISTVRDKLKIRNWILEFDAQHASLLDTLCVLT